jgi:hypothetical protein
MFGQLSAEIVQSLIKGRPNNNNTNTNTNNNNNKAKCIPGGTLRVLTGKNTNNSNGKHFRCDSAWTVIPSAASNYCDNNVRSLHFGRYSIAKK